MKKSIFFLVVFQHFLFTIACNHAERGAPTADMAEVGKSTDAYETTVDSEQSLAKKPEAPQDQQEEMPQTAPPPAPPQNQPQSDPGQQPAPVKIPRQIIKTAQYRIQVKDVNASSRQANRLATRHGGYVSDSELTNSSYETTNALTIRVPASQFDSLLDDLGQEAIFTQYKRINSQDVTEEYVDITVRLKTKIAVRDRYVDILRTKAKTVKDVLDAEEQIRIIQEEIEAKEGRLRFLKDQVGMSTIRLELYQEIEFRPEPSAFRESFWVKFVAGLKNGWELMQGLVIGLVTIWPLLLLFGLLFWKRRWIWRKVRRREA